MALKITVPPKKGVSEKHELAKKLKELEQRLLVVEKKLEKGVK